MEVREGLFYTKEHEWVRRDGEEVTIGITDYAQEQLSDIVYVELPEVGFELKQMEPFGSVEAVKAVSDLYAPVSGQVTAVNERLSDDPTLVNSSPYDEGWMLKAKLADASELDDLMDAAAYEAYVKELGSQS